MLFPTFNSTHLSLSPALSCSVHLSHPNLRLPASSKVNFCCLSHWVYGILLF